MLLAACAGANGESTNSGAALASRVVLVRDAHAAHPIEPAQVRAMVFKGLRELTGKADDAAAWATFVSSNDVVGIKISTQSAPLQATRRAVVEAIVEGLRAAGVAAENIVVWDRDGARMRSAGYEPARLGPGVRVVSVVADTGWDEMVYYQNNLVGRLIWGDLLFGRGEDELSNRSHLPKILTGSITKLINAPVLQDHESCGLAGCLYNISLGAVDNTRRYEGFGQRGDPMIPEIAAIPLIRDKLVLNIMDALVGGYAGGPTFKPRYSWSYGGLFFSRDPVAIDALCVELLEAKRREARIAPVAERASHINTAARMGLGQARRDHIELIEITP